MKQAKVLTDKEFKQLMSVTAAGTHGPRNRIALMLSHYAGLRVGEVAHLKVIDVMNDDGTIADQIHLNPAYTKGKVGRTVFVNTRLARELKKYTKGLSALGPRYCAATLDPNAPLIRSQKGAPPIPCANSCAPSMQEPA